MSLTKQDIYKFLEKITSPCDRSKNLVENNNVTNVLVFENKINIDVAIVNPTLHARKKIEGEIIQEIKKNISEEINIKVNVRIKKNDSKATLQQTKGKEIPNIKNVIAVASGKGGVGKSTIAANLAITLSKMGFSVGLLDADIYGPSQHIMFDVEKEKPVSINVGGINKMKPIENYGVKLLSLGFFTNPNQAVIWRGPMASKALNQLIFDSDWGELDFLLIDLPPGTGDVHLSMVQSLPINGAVIISTPQNIALADAKKGVAMFKQENIKVPVLGIIENMSYFIPEELPRNKHYIFGQNGAKHLAEDLKIKFLGEIPLVQKIREASDFGHPVALQKGTISENLFKEIAKEMISELLDRNTNLPPTEVVRITTMSGCSAKKIFG